MISMAGVDAAEFFRARQSLVVHERGSGVLTDPQFGLDGYQPIFERVVTLAKAYVLGFGVIYAGSISRSRRYG